MPERDACRDERRRIGQIWRRDPGKPSAGAGEAGEGRPQDAELADAVVRRHQLGERPGRPAAARQFRVELREPGRHARARHARERTPEPDVGTREEGGQWNGGVSKTHGVGRLQIEVETSLTFKLLSVLCVSAF